MSGIIASLAGAPQQAATFGSYYQNAANEIANEYGSPAAQMFSKEQAAALRPQFANQQQQLTSSLAAQGIAPSGAGRAAFGQLGADQAATLAGATAPLYQQGLSEYGSIIGAMPGMQTQGYQAAIQDLYGAIQDAAQAYGGMPPTGKAGTVNPGYGPAGQPSPQDTSNPYYVPGFDTAPDAQPWAPTPPAGPPAMSGDYFVG